MFSLSECQKSGLTSGGASSSYKPSIGIDSLGNIHIAWEKLLDGNYEIYYTKLDNNGNTLVDDTRLTFASDQSRSPDLVVDNENNIHLAWEDYRSGDVQVYYTKLDNNGNTLVDDTRLTFDSVWSSSPSISIDSFDNIHIAWVDYRGGNWEIYYTKLDNNGNTLVDDTRLTFTAGQGQRGSPSIGIDSFGNSHIAWDDFRDGATAIYYTKLDNNGNPLVDDTRLTFNPATAHSVKPSLGIDSKNNIHIAWKDTRNGDGEIYYTKLDNNGNTLVDDTRLTFTSDTESYCPSLGIDISDNIHIAWTDYRDGNPEIYNTKGKAIPK